MNAMLRRIAVRFAKRRFTDAASASAAGGSPTVIGDGSLFVGDLRVDGALILLGEIRGDGDVRGHLNLCARAHWSGDVHAHSAVIAGRLSGDLCVAGKLEIGQHAVIRGAVRAAQIAIANGAIVDGAMTTTTGAPIQSFEERRTTVDAVEVVSRD